MISGIVLLQPSASKFIRPCQNYIKFVVRSLAHRPEQKANIASKKYIFQLSLGVVFMYNLVELNLSCIVFFTNQRNKINPEDNCNIEITEPSATARKKKRCRLLGTQSRMQNSQFSRFASQPSRGTFQETDWRAARTLNRRQLLGILSRGHTPPVLFDSGT